MNPEHENPLSAASLRFASPGGLIDPDVAGTADVVLWADREVIEQLHAAPSSPTRRPPGRIAAA